MLVLGLLALLLMADSAPLRPGDHTRAVQVDGQERQYLVHVPAKYAPETPMPVVLALHGGGANAGLASELSDRIAAIAPVAGPVGTSECHPTRPVSVMHFHGDADEFAPFKGGKGRGPSGTDFQSVQHSIDIWVAVNGCGTTPTTTRLPDREDDGTAVKKVCYASGKEGAEVVLVVIEGGGHTWPGREPRMQALGVSTRDISANDIMWEFFKQHPMK